MICPLCTSKTIDFVHPNHDMHYTYCPHCEFIALNPCFYLNSEKEKKQYDQHHNSLENEGYVAMFEQFLDFFWENLPPHPTIMDFGSGPSPVLASLMQRRETNVACYDKFYAQNNRVLQKDTYDLITSTEVFEHLDKPLETLQTLSKCLKKGGYIAIMTLFHANNEADFWQWWYRRDPTHISFYTPKTFEVLAGLCGLKIVKNDKKRMIVLQKQ